MYIYHTDVDIFLEILDEMILYWITVVLKYWINLLSPYRPLCVSATYNNIFLVNVLYNV
jgi:hypothetical protein